MSPNNAEMSQRLKHFLSIMANRKQHTEKAD